MNQTKKQSDNPSKQVEDLLHKRKIRDGFASRIIRTELWLWTLANLCGFYYFAPLSIAISTSFSFSMLFFIHKGAHIQNVLD